VGQKLGKLDSTDAQTQRQIAEAHQELGKHIQAGRLTKAVGQYEQALQINRSLAASHGARTQSQLDLFLSLQFLADTKDRANAHDDAAALRRVGHDLLGALRIQVALVLYRKLRSRRCGGGFCCRAARRQLWVIGRRSRPNRWTSRLHCWNSAVPSFRRGPICRRGSGCLEAPRIGERDAAPTVQRRLRLQSKCRRNQS
jgi:hypothetical protein